MFLYISNHDNENVCFANNFSQKHNIYVKILKDAHRKNDVLGTYTRITIYLYLSLDYMIE